MDRCIKLYNKEGEHTLDVRLSEDGYKKYLLNDKWDSSWVEVMVDVKAVLKAEF